jgi:PAS domain S-box-containing protein
LIAYQTTNHLPQQVSRYLSASGTAEVQDFFQEGRHSWGVVQFPIHNAQGVEVGSLVTLHDMSASMAAFNSIVIVSLLICVLVNGVILAVFYVVFGRTDREIIASQMKLRQSEEEYRSLFSSTRDALLTLAPTTWRFTSCNLAAVKLFGFDEEAEVGGCTPWDLAPECQAGGEPSRDVFLSALRMTLDQESGYFEWDLLKRDGQRFPAAILVTRIELGGEPMLLASVRDISERRRIEQALRESEERMRVMFESVNAGIVLVDRETRTIADLNPAALRMHGGTREQLIGQPCRTLFHPDGSTVCPILDEGKELDLSERQYAQHQGTTLPILKSVKQVMVNGRPYLLESFVDLAEQKALEVALMLAKDSAEAASRAKSIFLASMSHEIRTPMNAILGYSQLLRRDRTLSHQQEQYLDIINRSGEHLLKLINDILEMSKIEAGTVQLTHLPFSFHGLLREIESLFSVRTSQKGLRFAIERVGEVPLALHADEGKIRQVFINLIGNGVKFTDQGGITVRVSAARSPATPGEALITVDVEDSGVGIADGEFDTVFAHFEQTESGRRRMEGTGLGMPISRQFARMMGGDLVILRSTPGAGSVFRFTFRAEERAAADLGPAVTAERRVRQVAPGAKEWRVLVVDDQDTNRSLLEGVLGQAGFVVRTAIDGADGVARFTAWHPDIVLMDLMMPGIDGYEAMRQIKASAAGTKPTVIAISASVMTEEHQRALEQGFDGFISKPVQIEELFDVIQRQAGVAYLYEDDRAAARNGPAAAPVDSEALKSLPDDLVAAMRTALEAGEMATLRELTSRCSDLDPSMAAALRRLVDDYAYDTLTKLLAEGAAHAVNA